MSVLVVATGVALLFVPVLAAGNALHPATRVRTACMAAVAGTWILGIGAFLTASPLLLMWHGGTGASTAGLTHLSPGGLPAWIAGGLLAGAGASWTVNSLQRSATLRRKASLPRWAADSVAYDENVGVEVRFAQTSRPVAFAVPGRDRHVVVSHAVTALLSDVELRAVLAHEGAHLRLHHDRHLLILGFYERVWGWLPGVSSVVARHRRSVEEWADLAIADDPEIDRQALIGARQILQIGEDDSFSTGSYDGPARSGLRQLAALTLVMTMLAGSALYSATHTVGDFTAAFAALH